MCPFSVTVEHVPDRELGPLLVRLSEAGFAHPIVIHVGSDGATERAAAAPTRPAPSDLPENWRLLHEREGECYRWPKRRDDYTPYRVFMGRTRREGAVQIGLGETIRENARGRDRRDVVASSAAARHSTRWSSSSADRVRGGRPHRSRCFAPVDVHRPCVRFRQHPLPLVETEDAGSRVEERPKPCKPTVSGHGSGHPRRSTAACRFDWRSARRQPRVTAGPRPGCRPRKLAPGPIAR